MCNGVNDVQKTNVTSCAKHGTGQTRIPSMICGSSNSAVLECAVVFLPVVVVSGHPQPSHRDGHPCTVDVLPGPTGVI